jgi:hypothetical protein
MTKMQIEQRIDCSYYGIGYPHDDWGITRDVPIELVHRYTKVKKEFDLVQIELHKLYQFKDGK